MKDTLLYNCILNVESELYFLLEFRKKDTSMCDPKVLVMRFSIIRESNNQD